MEANTDAHTVITSPMVINCVRQPSPIKRINIFKKCIESARIVPIKINMIRKNAMVPVATEVDSDRPLRLSSAPLLSPSPSKEENEPNADKDPRVL